MTVVWWGKYKALLLRQWKGFKNHIETLSTWNMTFSEQNIKTRDIIVYIPHIWKLTNCAAVVSKSRAGSTI